MFILQPERDRCLHILIMVFACFSILAILLTWSLGFVAVGFAILALFMYNKGKLKSARIFIAFSCVCSFISIGSAIAVIVWLVNYKKPFHYWYPWFRNVVIWQQLHIWNHAHIFDQHSEASILTINTLYFSALKTWNSRFLRYFPNEDNELI